MPRIGQFSRDTINTQAFKQAFRELASSMWPLTMPRLMAAPPVTSQTVSAGTNTQPASVLTSPKTISPWEPGAFTMLGAPWKRTRGNNYAEMGVWPTTGAKGTTIAEAELTITDATGRFEIDFHGTGLVAGNDACRVLIQSASGDWEYVTNGATFATTATGGNADVYKGLVTMGAPGVYTIRIECTSNFSFRGVTVDGLGAVRATRTPRVRGFLSVNSFGSTISDKGVSFPAGDNFATLLIYLTGWDIACCSVGAADYATDSPTQPVSNPRVSTHLLQDLQAWGKGDIIGFVHGGNDVSGTATAAQVSTGAQAALDIAMAYDPDMDVFFTSPFWPVSVLETSKSRLFAIRDAIKAVSETRPGTPFIDLVSAPPGDYLGAWTQTVPVDLAVGATTMTLATVPPTIETIIALGSVAAARNGWYIKIGNGDTAEVRLITGCTTGRVLTFNALTFAHAAGEPIELAGPGLVSGVGCQAAIAVATTTTGTLVDPWPFAAGNYVATFPSGVQRTVAVVAGTAGQALNWAAGGAITDNGTVTVSICSLATGNAGTDNGPDGTHPTKRGHRGEARSIATRMQAAFAPTAIL